VNENLKIVAALIAFLTLVGSLEFAAGYAFYYVLEPENKQRFLAMLSPQLELLIELKILGLIILSIAFTVAWQLYVKGPLKIVEGIRIILNAHPSHRLEPSGPIEVRALAQAVNALAEQSETLASALETKVAQAKSSVEQEKNRLAALMSELSQGVLVCNSEGRILLYNERARQALSTPGNSQGTAALVGLGRSITAIVDCNQLDHALESLRSSLNKGEADPNAQFVVTTRAGQFIRVRMAPVLAATQASSAQRTAINGFVMTLENITRAFEVDATRDMLLQSFTEGSRSALANIRAAVETLMHYPDCAPDHRDRFLQVIHEETCGLSNRLDQTTAEHADSLKTRWPLEEMLGVDLVAAAQRRIESRLGMATLLETPDEGLWIKADSYTLVQALSYLAGRLQNEVGVRELRFHLARHARIAELDIVWTEPLLSQRTLYGWETDPMHAGGEDSPLSFRDVIERHGAEIVYMVDQVRQQPLFRWLLPLAQPTRPLSGATIRYDESRPEFYDFDLFHQAGQTPELDHRLLTELAYTVFDTETTGLNPMAGDEIISIGAVRIVNQRLLRYDTYEQLIDPKRPIDSMSQTIHGISNEMLRGQPTIHEALSQFHQYCADAVLVGHNAAFDMRFLQLKEAQTSVRFTQPVLDTLLLSEVLHPHQESHALEAIAARLGVTVLARHTALGDALVTGEAFLRMIPLLAAQGIRTLGDARAATEKIYQKVKY